MSPVKNVTKVKNGKIGKTVNNTTKIKKVTNKASHDRGCGI